MSTTTKTPSPRIACLIPSATDICLALGLHDQIVGITHECATSPTALASLPSHVRILTRDGLAPSKPNDTNDKTTTTTTTQDEEISQQLQIHLQVQQAQQQQQCANDFPPSLYPILADEFMAANPDIVITQDLCQVCAPSQEQVQSLIVLSSSDQKKKKNIQIVSLSPHSLSDVLDTIVTVAHACGVPERGRQLRETYQTQLQEIRNLVSSQPQHPPNVLLLEWLDPPFDGGHWIVDMMEYAGCVNVLESASFSSNTTTTNSSTKIRKSTCRSWKDIQTCQPDTLWVASCGRTLEQNVQDCHIMASELLQACRNTADTTDVTNNNNSRTRVIALNGDTHFARPGPSLVLGVAIMAWTAYPEDSSVRQALAKSFPVLAEQPADHFRVLSTLELQQAEEKNKNRRQSTNRTSSQANAPLTPPDVEDCGPTNSGVSTWDQLHEKACQAGEMSYTDPDSGYSVFTAVAHQKRGRCCGSGCRHCPYSHENVIDKAGRIQQPAFLYNGPEEESPIHEVFVPLQQAKSVKVLFFSGGKDSFLTIRTLVRRQLDELKKENDHQKEERYALVLLTTFDATSRIIAHQEVDVKCVVRQAQHLGLPLVGVPRHRGTKMSYVAQIKQGLQVICDKLENRNGTITSLVFGDLHLDHIRSWRQDHLGPLGYEMMFPLWEMQYQQLAQDLEASSVPCIVSDSTIDAVETGEPFDASLRQRLQELNNNSDKADSASLDLFGEKGEFHTLAKVWEVDPKLALGLDGSDY